MANMQWPIAVSSVGSAAAGAIVWRQRGQLHVTVVVKGTFAWVPDGVMAVAEAEPIARDETTDAAGTGLSAACDLAPYLQQVDVWLTGSAPETSPSRPHTRPGLPEGSTSGVRLGVFRDAVAVLDKSLDLTGIPRAVADGRPGAQGGIPLTGMGPLSRRWPVRRNLLGALNPRQLEGVFLDIPEVFDWAYFQAAPPDQRLDSIRGDEWIALAGMHPERASFSTRLPGASAAARLYGRAGALRAGRALQLLPDTLRIDVDRQICSVTWRGQFPVSGPDALAAMHVAAGVELPGRPLAWVNPLLVDAEGEARGRRRKGALPGNEAAPLSSEAVARLAAAMPFKPRGKQAGAPASAPPLAPNSPGDRPVAPDPLGTTGVFHNNEAGRPAAPATPFEKARPAAPSSSGARPVPSSSHGARPIPSSSSPGAMPVPSPSQGLAPVPATASWGAATSPDLLGATMSLSPEAVAEALRGATPFDRSRAVAKGASVHDEPTLESASPAAPNMPVPAKSRRAATMTLSASEIAAASAAVLPFDDRGVSADASNTPIPLPSRAMREDLPASSHFVPAPASAHGSPHGLPPEGSPLLQGLPFVPPSPPAPLPVASPPAAPASLSMAQPGAPSPPPVLVAPSAAAIQPGEATAAPKGLGAHFLAATARRAGGDTAPEAVRWPT